MSPTLPADAPAFTPRNPDFAARTHDSFNRQGFMTLIGARLDAIEAGICRISLEHRADLTQQHGFFHGGLVGTLADTAGGYAGFSLLGASDSILTIEFKINLLAPGRGERLVATGVVRRAGGRLIICNADVVAIDKGVETVCATALLTFMRMEDRSDHAPTR